MTNKGTKKGKKPLQTTLGKAPGQNEKEVDVAHLKRPIDTSVFGLKQILTLFTTATEEEPSQPPNPPESTASNIEIRRSSRNLEDLDLGQTLPAKPTSKGLLPVIAKLKEKQEISRLTQEIINKDFSNEKKEEVRMGAMTNNDLLLEEIATNNAAVFQTVLQDMPQKTIGKPELIKSEVMEIHGMLDSDEAVLGADGKICKFQTNKINNKPNIPKLQLVCTECNMQFSTKKTLTFHLKNKHNKTSLVYVCPDCKDTFANTWCVYRHLYKVHRKSSAQVKRLREQVHNSVVRKDCEPNKKLDKKEMENLDKTDEENQWLNNIEGDNAFQMCGGCGKRFERKAALHSHAAMCIKRIAVCNSIKENNAKKKEEESKDAKLKVAKVDKTVTVEAPKGASKRKPYLLRTYKTLEKIEQLPDVNDNKIVCDNQEIVSESKHQNGSVSDIIGSEALPTIKDIIENEENLFVKSEKQFGEQSLPKDPHSGEFDIFCKRVLEHLMKTGVSKELEKFSNVSGTDRSSEKVKSDTVATKSDDIFVESVTPSTAETCSELEMNTSAEAQAVSPCRISIRSLDDLIGFSKEEQAPRCKTPIAKTPRSKTPVAKTPSPPRKQSQSPKNLRSPRAPRSPRSPRKCVQRPNKRKRTKSLDLDGADAKKSDFEALSDDRDLAFMTKAAPHMDGLKLRCKSCGTKYPTLAKLLWHMSAHFSWFRFQCSRCSFITFSKTDCAEHAEKSHGTGKNEIGSIVLPIPNWKTALMSHEFRELKNAQEMCGIHTDEVMVGHEGKEEALSDTREAIEDNIIDTLFIDSDTETAGMTSEDAPPFPMPILGDAAFIKTESIDIVDEDKDSFQMEMPDEIYTMDVFEVVEIDAWVNDRYDDRNELRIKSERRDSDDFVMPEADTASDPKVVSIKTEDPVVNVRPIRNRMRSIKTLQNDFFYDLKGGKVSENAASKTNGLPKLKRNGPNPYSRKEKSMRVYSKK